MCSAYRYACHFHNPKIKRSLSSFDGFKRAFSYSVRSRKYFSISCRCFLQYNTIVKLSRRIRELAPPCVVYLCISFFFRHNREEPALTITMAPWFNHDIALKSISSYDVGDHRNKHRWIAERTTYIVKYNICHYNYIQRK